MNLEEIENELKKRVNYPYIWGKKQDDYYNGLTNFIYQTFSFDDLLKEIDKRFKDKPDYDNFFNYALNRWYNFWSAQAVESIFCSLPNVEASLDNKDRLVDFKIKEIAFDHKTSVFPRGYPGSLNNALDNPNDLIEWLYKNQSQQQRKHLKNRLFIILYSKTDDHWKLKSEVQWLKDLIEQYIKDFNPQNLKKFSFEANSVTLSDIIWGIK